MSTWEDREQRAAQLARRSRLLHIIPSICHGLHRSMITPLHPGVVLAITVSFNVSIILKSLLSSTKASLFQPPPVSDCFWEWSKLRSNNLIPFATLNSLCVSSSSGGEMITAGNVMGITEDWTGMKVVGGVEGCKSKDEGNCGLVRFKVFYFVQIPSLIYFFVAGKGVA